MRSTAQYHWGWEPLSACGRYIWYSEERSTRFRQTHVIYHPRALDRRCNRIHYTMFTHNDGDIMFNPRGTIGNEFRPLLITVRLS